MKKISILFCILILIAGCKNHSKEYYPNGKIKRMSYNLNKEDSRVRSYYESGTISSIEQYRKKMKNGACIYFYENGNISSLLYFKNNIQDGIFQTYYENGALRSKGVSKNGSPIGKSYLLSIDGKMLDVFND